MINLREGLHPRGERGNGETISIEAFIRKVPKSELHIHIEGSLEPELMFAMARRNGLPLRYESVERLRAAYQFRDLQSFLDIYCEGAAVLREERDFYEMAMAYLRRAAADNVRHAEIFFDPQTHRPASSPGGRMAGRVRECGWRVRRHDTGDSSSVPVYASLPIVQHRFAAREKMCGLPGPGLE
jgi:adenosine deaminase